MTELYPYQAEGARFLAEKKRALLADKVRVGKTGSGIGGADEIGADYVLELTKGSARRNHARMWRDFQKVRRKVTPLYSGRDDVPTSGVVITSYDLAAGALFKKLRLMGFEVVIPDECHRLMTHDAQRTKAVYGEKCDGDGGLIEDVEYVWPMSGTPAPRHYGQLWTMMRAVMPDAIEGSNGKPMSRSAFEQRYCVKKHNGFGFEIVGNKNADDLKARLGPRMLRRTLQDVRKDHPPLIYDTLELDATDALAELKELERSTLVRDLSERLDAATSDESRETILAGVEKTLALRLRRLTGLAKVAPVVDWVAEQFEDGMEKLVLFAWHRDVIDALHATLARRGISSVRLYGGMSAGANDGAQDAFQVGKTQVFVGQTEAAGEAIDLSAADEMVFVEADSVPGRNEQAAHRVVNVNKMRSTLARFATLVGSIDEKIQRVLMRRTADLAKIFG